jgi:hypothetical protein
MARRLIDFVLPVLGMVSIGCTHPTGSGDTPPPSTATEPGAAAPVAEEPSRAAGRAPAIATIVTHDARVTLLGGRGGSDDLRFVVRNADGALIADGIDAEQLRTSNPALHAIVMSSVAARGRGTYIDATLHRPLVTAD